MTENHLLGLRHQNSSHKSASSNVIVVAPSYFSKALEPQVQQMSNNDDCEAMGTLPNQHISIETDQATSKVRAETKVDNLEKQKCLGIL